MIKLLRLPKSLSPWSSRQQQISSKKENKLLTSPLVVLSSINFLEEVLKLLASLKSLVNSELEKPRSVIPSVLPANSRRKRVVVREKPCILILKVPSDQKDLSLLLKDSDLMAMRYLKMLLLPELTIVINKISCSSRLPLL